ncbi:MAG: hypothetical protein ABI675_05770 [Chitinophagaceae bacterium]
MGSCRLHQISGAKIKKSGLNISSLDGWVMPAQKRHNAIEKILRDGGAKWFEKAENILLTIREFIINDKQFEIRFSVFLTTIKN